MDAVHHDGGSRADAGPPDRPQARGDAHDLRGRGPAGLRQVLAAVEERSARGIAAAVSRLVSDGTLPVGSRLPTVRDVAAALEVSPATVSTAWRALSDVGVLHARGRAGSFVRERPSTWLPPRYRDLAPPGPGTRLDLSTGTPDPELLPDLGPALASVASHAVTTSYVDAPVIAPLERHLRASWPYPVESLTVVDGAFDALSRSLEQVVRFGDRVVVENPCFPPLIDLLDQLGAEPVPAELDEQGLLPDGLARALALGPTAIVLQPRAHNPTGASLTPARARELADVLTVHRDERRAVVLEDDHSGDISTAPDVSLGRHLPDRVLHVRSFSKSHGPDLRIAALGGPAVLVDRIVARRMLGPGWTSRMLQQVLLELITGADGIAAVARARRVYEWRQRMLTSALRARGVPVAAGDGINLWLPVADEPAALVHLAAAGLRAAPGRPFCSGDAAAGHIRVTAGRVRDGFDEVAGALADAARRRSP